MRRRRSPLGGSGSVEPGAVTKSLPPAARGRMTGHPLDRPLAFREPLDATEADRDFLTFFQPQQARRDSSIAAAPATGLPGEVAADGSLVHRRLMLALGIVRNVAPDPHVVAAWIGE